MRAVLSLLGIVAFASVGASGCSDGGGAISARWRIIDLQSGVGYDPRTFDGPEGVCLCPAPATSGRSGDCAPEYGWTVHRIEVELTEETTDQPMLKGDPRLVFNCSSREATTPFIIPPGNYAIRLRAVDPTRQSATGESCVEGHTPPAVTRRVRQGDIVNVDVVEVGILFPPAAGSCP